MTGPDFPLHDLTYVADRIAVTLEGIPPATLGPQMQDVRAQPGRIEAQPLLRRHNTVGIEIQPPHTYAPVWLSRSKRER